LPNSWPCAKSLPLVLILSLLLGCYTTEKAPVGPDPVAIATDGKRDDGSGGRPKVLRNPIFSTDLTGEHRSAGIPVNPVCLRPVPNTEGEKPPFTEKEQPVIALFPSDRRVWTSPILIRSRNVLEIQEMIENRLVTLDLGSIPDGRYNVLICRNESSCKLPTTLKAEGLSDGLGINLRSPTTKKFRFLEKDGLFENQGFTTFIRSFTADPAALIGIGANIWVEQGQLVWPKDPVSFWNGRMIPETLAGKKEAFTDERASIPVVHVNYRPANAGAIDGFCFPELNILVIDLGNRGLEMSSLARGITVDFEKDYSPERISWPAKAGTGFLVLDKTKSGTFAGISDLITTNSTGPDAGKLQNPFEQLRKFDENRDGFINSQDGMYPYFGVWVDKNFDGKLDKSETLSLKESKIESISVRPAEIPESDEIGNSSLFRSVAKMAGTNRHLLVYSLRLMITSAGNAGSP
jgi:hypothetical protein